MTTNYCYKKLKEKVEKLEAALEANTEADEHLAERVTENDNFDQTQEGEITELATELGEFEPATDSQINDITD